MPKPRVALLPPSPETDRQTLGDRLRIAREYVGLKQEEVAQHLNIQRSALSNIEAGQRKVEALELSRLAKLYQRPLSWFTGDDLIAEGVYPAEIAHVARAAARLSSQDRQELARFADFLKSRARTKVSDDGK
ncbi:MAG: XRE family transcriptional regulator [Rhodocyclaceae bacterium]|nr:MAG: XRE family transcriptional regulator [Rhodocyclaceae bacterium]